MSLLLDIQPSDLGFKAPFNDYLPIQNEVIDFVAESFGDDIPVVGVASPTGSGKSLSAVSIARALGLRTVISTVFKGLQQQYLDDFKPYGMVDIRGRNNYQCAQFDHLTCHGGSSVGCLYTKGKGCSYEVEKSIAKEANLLTTNLTYWMNVNDKANGLERTEKESDEFGENPIELLIIDECHQAPQALAEYISCRLFEHDAKRFGGAGTYPMNESLIEWSQWARVNLPILNEDIKSAQVELIVLGKKVTKRHIDELHRLQALAGTLNKLMFMSGGDWVVEMEVGTKYGRAWKFDCIWPGKFAKQYLFCNVPRVLAMSATNKEKTLWDMGVKKEDYRFRSWRRIFPANRHPIYRVHCKKSNGSNIRLSKKSPIEDIEMLIDWMDREIIKPRLDRKGMILTMSYDYQNYVFDFSQYSHFMIGNRRPDYKNPEDTAQRAAEEFRAAKPPAILTSPSFGMGYDFKYQQCEYLIVFKTPWIPAFNKIMKARCAKDPMYAGYQGMQILEQSVGRPMRAFDDRAEVFLIDGTIEGFLHQYGHLAQDWFLGAIRGVPSVPKPPPKL